jgi:formiminoglutamate deiminase
VSERTKASPEHKPSLWFETALLPSGWARSVRLMLKDGVIGRVEADAAPEPGDERHGAGLPGLANLHSHAFQRAMAGLTEASPSGLDDFWSWREVMYRFVERLGPDEVEAIAAQAYMEMLESGFTRVGEFHYLHHGPDGRPYADPAEMAARIAAAADETGIGLTLLPVFYAQSGFSGAPPTSGQRRFVSSLEGYSVLQDAARRSLAALPDAIVGTAPHSLRAVSPDDLRSLLALAPRAPVHIHIAEQTKEVEDCRAATGQSPVAWLLDHVDVDADWCLVHATHMNSEETARLARSRAVAGLCPITEANLGDGIFPAEAFWQEGGRFGVGSDSNVSIDASEELRLLDYGQRLVLRRRSVKRGAVGSSGSALFRGSLEGGFQALGVDAFGLTEGASGDLISLDLAHPALAARAGEALLDSFIFAGGRHAIEAVWRRGRKVVSGGRHVGRGRIARRFSAVMRALAA